MSIAEYSLLAARLLLAAVFLLAGSAKLVDPVGSRKALRGFGLPSALSRPMVLLLPLLEIAVAVTLLPAALAWYGAWGAMALLAAFLIAVGIAMLRGRKPDCHCFGQVHSAPVGPATLVRNFLLALCAALVVMRGQGRSGPGLWTWFISLDGSARKVALSVAGVAAIVFFALVARARPARKPVEPPAPLVDIEDSPEELPDPARRVAAAAVERPVETAPGPLDIGLPIGTLAPEFELPAITGEKRSLRSLRAGGSDVVLIFSSPFCKPCEVLATNLVRWRQELKGLPNIVMISRGAPQENLAKLKEFGPSQVLLQGDSEVAHAYDCSTTPTAVLIGADGLIRSELVTGGPAIRNLLASRAKQKNVTANAADTKAAQRASAFGS